MRGECVTAVMSMQIMAGTRDTGALGKHPQMGKELQQTWGVPSTLTRDHPKRGTDDSGKEQSPGAGVYIEPWHNPRRLEADLTSLSPYSLMLGQDPDGVPLPGLDQKQEASDQ